jgi:hypothetical protein
MIFAASLESSNFRSFCISCVTMQFRNDLDNKITSPRTPIDSLNLEISPSSSPKLNISGELIALRESLRDTIVRDPPAPDSPSSKRRGTVAVLKPGTPRSSSGARDDSSSPSLRRSNSKISVRDSESLVPKHVYLDLKSVQVWHRFPRPLQIVSPQIDPFLKRNRFSLFSVLST